MKSDLSQAQPAELGGRVSGDRVKAYLAGAKLLQKALASSFEDSLDELSSLAGSAAFEPVGNIIFKRERPDPAYFIGSGQAEKLRELALEAEAVCVVFDRELSAVQERNLVELLGMPVIDRSELILRIFASRARSKEGKMQVELARLEHLSARLVRGWSHLERQRGGIGVRGGPGEKQVELDRRMIGVKIKKLRVDLDKMSRQRKTRRRARARGPTFNVAIVGYTNAGKSTLFNRMTGASSYAADQLFATLDTLTREIPAHAWPRLMPRIALSDTVGFVRDLPHQLVDAFHATLEETLGADLLLHVVDASSPDREAQIAQVNKVLATIGAAQIPQLMVLNKVDKQAGDALPCGSIERVFISAQTGLGMDVLIEQIMQAAVQCLEKPSDGPHLEAAEDVPADEPLQLAHEQTASHDFFPERPWLGSATQA